MANIIPWNSADNGNQYLTEPTGKYIDASNYPWVEIGNLYVTILESGGESNWSPLVKYIADVKKNPNIVLMSGRHGGRFGTILNIGGSLHKDMIGLDHLKSDSQGTKDVNMGRPAAKKLNFEIVEAQKMDADQLKQEAAKHLQAGKAVIFAWCHSLYTFNEHVMDSFGELRPVTKTHIVDCLNTPISDVVRAHFRWAFGIGSIAID